MVKMKDVKLNWALVRNQHYSKSAINRVQIAETIASALSAQKSVHQMYGSVKYLELPPMLSLDSPGDEERTRDEQRLLTWETTYFPVLGRPPFLQLYTNHLTVVLVLALIVAIAIIVFNRNN